MLKPLASCFCIVPGLAMTSTNDSDGDVSELDLQFMFRQWISQHNSKATTILFLAVITGISNFVDQFPQTIREKLPATLKLMSAAKFTVCDALGRGCCGVTGLHQLPARGPMEDDQWVHPQVTGWLLEEQSCTTPLMLDWWLDQICHSGLTIEFSLHAALELIDGSPAFPQKDCLHRWLKQLMDECLQRRPAQNGVCGLQRALAWKGKVEALVREIPEVLGDNPEEERLRDLAIEKVRDVIADRWVAVRNIAAHSHASQYEELVQATKAILAQLVSAYGADIHFAPFADVGCPLPSPPSAHGGDTDGVAHRGEDEGETTSSQVARRVSYKGAASTKVRLPMDAATVIGVVAIFGSILPATALTPAALKTCTACFDALQAVACMSETLVLIPELPRMVLPFENNKVKMSALRSVLKTLDLKPDRPVIQPPFLHECVTIGFKIQAIQASKQTKGVAGLLRKLPENETDKSVSLSHLLIALFRARGEKFYSQDEMLMRVLRRLVHIFCQKVEVSLENAMTSTCPKRSPGEQDQGKAHPHSKASRLRGNKSLQMALVEQFQTKSSGFVTAKHMSLHEMGVKDSRSFGSRTTAEYCCRLLAKNVEFFSKYSDMCDWKTLNLCIDMASVSHEYVFQAEFRKCFTLQTNDKLGRLRQVLCCFDSSDFLLLLPEVLSLVFRMDSHQWAGPTQVLPLGPTAEEAAKALETLRVYLGGRIPAKPVSQISANLDAFKWKEYRTSTKNLLVAFANSIQQVMPKGFSLKSCVPPNPLLPMKPTETRAKLTEGEKMAMGLEGERMNRSLYFVFDHKSFDARTDWQHLVRELESGNPAACELVDLYLPSICRDLNIDQDAGTMGHVLDILKRKGGKVLADDQNQDQMRSFLVVFGPYRKWTSEMAALALAEGQPRFFFFLANVFWVVIPFT
eukprot:s1017_g5.t1